MSEKKINGRYHDHILDTFGSLKEFQRVLKEYAGRRKLMSTNGKPIKFSYPWVLRHVNNPMSTPWRMMRFVAQATGKSACEIDTIIGEGEE